MGAGTGRRSNNEWLYGRISSLSLPQVELNRHQVPRLENGSGVYRQCKFGLSEGFDGSTGLVTGQMEGRRPGTSPSYRIAVFACVPVLPVPGVVHHHVHPRPLQQLLLCRSPAGHRHGLQNPSHHPLLCHTQRQTGEEDGIHIHNQLRICTDTKNIY